METILATMLIARIMVTDMTLACNRYPWHILTFHVSNIIGSNVDAEYLRCPRLSRDQSHFEKHVLPPSPVWSCTRTSRWAELQCLRPHKTELSASFLEIYPLQHNVLACRLLTVSVCTHESNVPSTSVYSRSSLV